MKPKPGQICKYCNVPLTRDNAHLHSGGRRHYFKIAGWCQACHDKVVLGGLCVRPGCTNIRVWNRRICAKCACVQSNEAKKKRKQEPAPSRVVMAVTQVVQCGPVATVTGYGPDLSLCRARRY
jgi:hypothetical protein